MQVDMEQIGPTEASALLAGNVGNRKLRPAIIDRLAGAIMRGEWAMNGETIKVFTSGRIDGQHRLSAIVKAGVTVPVLIVRNVPEVTYDTVNQSAQWRPADFLASRGVPNATAVAASLRWVDAMNNNGKKRDLTERQRAALLGAHPGLLDWAAYFSSNASKKALAGLIEGGPFIAIMTLAEEAWGKIEVLKFADCVVAGAGLDVGHPALTLRNRLLEAKIKKTLKTPDATKAAWLIHALNANHAEREMKIVKHLADAPFPRLVGRSEVQP